MIFQTLVDLHPCPPAPPDCPQIYRPLRCTPGPSCHTGLSQSVIMELPQSVIMGQPQSVIMGTTSTFNYGHATSICNFGKASICNYGGNLNL